MGAERGQNDPWTPDLVERVATDLDQRFPSGEWDDNVRERDRRLVRLQADEQDRSTSPK